MSQRAPTALMYNQAVAAGCPDKAIIDAVGYFCDFFGGEIHHFEFGDEIVAVVVGDKAQLVALRGIDRVIIQIAPIDDQFAFAFAGFLDVALHRAVLFFDMRFPVAVELFGRYASGFFSARN